MKKIISESNSNSFKMKLCQILLRETSFEFDLPEFKLLTISSDIEPSSNLDSHNYLKYIYFKKNKIHSIYNSEKINSFINNDSIKKLYYLFYLNLLINDDSNIINFENSLEILLNISNDLSNPNNIKSYKELLISKVILNLINNNNVSNNNYKEKETELNTIKNNCEITIKNNIDIFKELNLNYSFKDFVSKKIDKIYSDIIIEIIKSDNFETFGYIHNIAEELDLESINITKTIYEELYEILNKEEYAKRYIISDLTDLAIPIKINFYYFLLKYIFKSSFYIYQIPFLLNIRKNIINFLKGNLEELCIPKINGNNNIKEKRNYIIKKLLDSDFYYKKYFDNLKYDHLEEILYYYKYYFFESKAKDIKIIEELLENEVIEKNCDYLKDYENAKYMNDRLPIFLYLYDIKLEKEKLNISEKQIHNKFESYQLIERVIKDKKYKKMKNDIKNKLLNYFMDKKNKNILNKIFNEIECTKFINDNLKKKNKKNEIKDIEKNLVKNDIKENKKIEEDNKKNNEIKEKYKIEENNKIENNSNLIINTKDKSSLKTPSEKSSNLNEFQTSSNIIVQSVYIQDSSSAINIDKNKTNSTIINENDTTLRLKLNEDYINKGKTLFKKSSSYKIIEIIKVLDENKKSDFFKNTSKGIYISGGANKKLIIYNEYFEKKLEIGMKDWIYDTIEINTEEQNEIKLLSCCNNYIIDNNINLENFKIKRQIYESGNKTIQSIFKLKNNCIAIGGTGIILIENFFDTTKPLNIFNIIDKNYRGGIQINKFLFAFTSNSNIPNGEDKLIIYNYKRKAIVQTIEEYSFIVSSNGLCLIDNKIDENNKILLCACKKYYPQQKNGILLINLEINDDLKIQKFFYDTDDFEVNCFCQICNVENNNAIGEDITHKENINIYKTEFVLVCGFDGEKKGGMIKLYEIIKNSKSNCEKLEFLQDIEFEINDNFNGFENSISCITQSNITGNIIVTCWDGNTYLLNPPNIDFYLK